MTTDHDPTSEPDQPTPDGGGAPDPVPTTEDAPTDPAGPDPFEPVAPDPYDPVAQEPAGVDGTISATTPDPDDPTVEAGAPTPAGPADDGLPVEGLAAGEEAGDLTLANAAAGDGTTDDIAPSAAETTDTMPGLETPAEKAVAERGSGGGSGKRLLVIGAILVAILAIGAIAYAVVQNRIGSPDDALAAIPSDVAMVMSIDLRHFSDNEGYDRMLAAMDPLLAEADAEIESVDDAIAEIDRMLEDELGVTLTDDVFPWIGRSAAFSLTDLSAVEDGAEPEGVLFAASIRDEEAARDFVDKLIAGNEAEVERRTVEGASTEAYVLDLELETGWVLVENDLLTIASDEATLVRSLAAVDSGEGVADDEAYRTVVDELPADSGVRMFMSGEFLTEAMNEAQATLEDVGETPEVEVADFAMSMGLTDLGIAMNFVTSTAVIEGIDSPTILPPPLGADLPDDTLFYLGFAVETDPPTIGALLREQDDDMMGSVEEFEESFLGTDSLSALLDQITPEFAIALTPALGGMPMAGALPVDISGLLSLGISDRDAVIGITEDIAEWVGMAGVTVERTGDEWEVLIGPDSPILVWTVTDDAIRIATDRSVLGAFAEDGGTDSTTDDTATDDTATDDTGSGDGPNDLSLLDDALPGDGVNFYVDIAGFIDAIGAAGPDTDVFAGFDSVAASVEERDDLVHVGMIIKLTETSGDGVDALDQ